MNNIIDQVYVQNNYPGYERLYNLVKVNNPKIKRKDVKEFLENNVGEQLLKITRGEQTKKKSKKKQGSITAKYENELWEMDIYDLSKFAKYNSNYQYILCVIDVFTRKVYCQAMKNKNVSDCITAFEKIISSGNIPHSLFSDNDSSFLSKSFTNMLDQNRIAFNVNTINDHHALGIIDNFARRLKLIISKNMLRNNDKNWVNHLQTIITRHNNQKTTSLNNLKPTQVTKPKNNQIVYDINVEKSKNTNMKSDLAIGDHVRLKTAGMFTKSSDLQYSEEIYKVVGVIGGNIELDNGKTVKRSQLLKIPKTTQASKTTNVLTQVKKTAKVDRVLKAEGLAPTNILKTKKQIQNTLRIGGIDESNILTTSRRRK